MIQQELEAICDGMAVVIREVIADATKPLIARIAELEKRTFADVYRGVWQPGTYERGSAVTWEGSLWICRMETTAKPGTNADWQLAVKRGSPGKDARP